MIILVIDSNYLSEVEEDFSLFDEHWSHLSIDAIERRFKDKLKVLIDNRDEVEQWLIKNKHSTGLIYYFVGNSIQKYRTIPSTICSTIFYKRGEWSNINKLYKQINGYEALTI